MKLKQTHINSMDDVTSPESQCVLESSNALGSDHLQTSLEALGKLIDHWIDDHGYPEDAAELQATAVVSSAIGVHLHRLLLWLQESGSPDSQELIDNAITVVESQIQQFKEGKSPASGKTIN